MTNTDNSLVVFKAIVNFTSALEEIFGEDSPLKLYHHLITKTTLAHSKAITKHIKAFRAFCVDNRDAFEVQDVSKLKVKKISYSDRVYINIGKILSIADKETSTVIWQHLLTLAALVDPTGKARQILKTNIDNEQAAPESNFLTNIIEKVEQHVDPDSNPMEAVSSIMKSGIFSDLVGGMGNGLQDGTLDLSKLMGTVQNMVTSLSEKMDTQSNEQSNGENPDPFGLINSMIGSINAGAESANSNEGPDLSAMMNMMGPMLGALNKAGKKNTLTIEEQIDSKVEHAKQNGTFVNTTTSTPTTSTPTTSTPTTTTPTPTPTTTTPTPTTTTTTPTTTTD